MKAEVVTSLFFSSTWLSPTLLLTCLQPSWLIAAAVSVVSGYLKGNISSLITASEVTSQKENESNHTNLLLHASPFRINDKNNKDPDIDLSSGCILMMTDSLIILFNTNSDLTARKHFGSQDRGDAAEANGFPLAMERLQHILHLAINRAILPLYGPCTQIFGRTKTTCMS